MTRRPAKPRAPRRRQQPEYEAQCAVFAWAALMEGRYPDLKLLFSTLNGVRTSMRQAIKAKKAGMKKGVPDIWLPVRTIGEEVMGYVGLVGEMKAPKGVDSPEQKAWLTALSRQGWQIGVWYSAEEAIETIARYLGIPTHDVAHRPAVFGVCRRQERHRREHSVLTTPLSPDSAPRTPRFWRVPQRAMRWV